LTGASGFVGSHLKTALEQRGHTVTPLGRQPTLHPEADALVLCGAMVDGCEEAPSEAMYCNALNPWRWAKGFRGYVLFISTGSAMEPENVYQLSKRLGEEAVLLACPDCCIVRLNYSYGEGQAPNRLYPRLIKQIGEGKRVKVSHENKLYPTPIAYAVTRLIDLIETKTKGMFVVRGKPKTVRQIVGELGGECE